MALSLKIEFYPGNNNRPEFILEPHWWNTEELLADFPFSESVQNGYKNYNLVVSMEQLKKIHDQQSRYADPAHSRVEENIVAGQFQYVFDSPTVFRKIQLNIYEWDTGN
jgi:hypothetical protein